MGDELGQRIADAVVAEFNKLRSGKPVVRSNGVKEWTVLSGIVVIDGSSITPLTIATGVKTLPDMVRSYSKGLFVHDMHAEILAIRLFNWWLLNEASKLKNNESSDFIQMEEDNFIMKPGLKLGLYISEPPCGDASMGYLSQDSIPWESGKRRFEDDEEDDESNTDNKRVHRGRGHYDRLGIVRTKPGRSDSLISYSKSCSDKLCLRQMIGLNNSFTSTLFPIIHLDYLVVRQDKYTKIDFDRCFNRISGHNLQVLLYQNDNFSYHKNEKSNKSCPSELAIIKVVPTNTMQVLNNGVRNGSYVKKSVPRPGGESFICNQSIYRNFRHLLDYNDTYINFKNSNESRQKLKAKGQEILGNWKRTSDDDFVFGEVKTP